MKLTAPNPKQRQQGDVTIEYVATMPKGGTAIKPSARGFVIAEGEHTNHAHVLEAEGVLEVREVDGVIYARIEAPSNFSHDEHHTKVLAPGVVKFGRVQEYDHFAEEARTVQD